MGGLVIRPVGHGSSGYADDPFRIVKGYSNLPDQPDHSEIGCHSFESRSQSLPSDMILEGRTGGHPLETPAVAEQQVNCGH
jgi:hypothetical protein